MMQMPEEGTWKQYVGHGIQDFEMMSLFVLFMHFYRKAYSKRKAKSAEKLSSGASAESETSDTLAEQESISSASSDEHS
jgi:hypothetical protein